MKSAFSSSRCRGELSLAYEMGVGRRASTGPSPKPSSLDLWWTSRPLPLGGPPTAIRLSSSTGSATATEALRPVGPYRRGDLTGLSGSCGRLGGSDPSHRLRDGPYVFGA